MVPLNKYLLGDKWMRECKNKWNVVFLFLNKERKGHTMLITVGATVRLGYKDIIPKA